MVAYSLAIFAQPPQYFLAGSRLLSGGFRRPAFTAKMVLPMPRFSFPLPSGKTSSLPAAITGFNPSSTFQRTGSFLYGLLRLLYLFGAPHISRIPFWDRANSASPSGLGAVRRTSRRTGSAHRWWSPDHGSQDTHLQKADSPEAPA